MSQPSHSPVLSWISSRRGDHRHRRNHRHHHRHHHRRSHHRRCGDRHHHRHRHRHRCDCRHSRHHQHHRRRPGDDRDRRSCRRWCAADQAGPHRPGPGFRRGDVPARRHARGWPCCRSAWAGARRVRPGLRTARADSVAVRDDAWARRCPDGEADRLARCAGPGRHLRCHAGRRCCCPEACGHHRHHHRCCARHLAWSCSRGCAASFPGARPWRRRPSRHGSAGDRRRPTGSGDPWR